MDLDRAFDQAAEEFGLPRNLLLAIAQHESRTNPWALNLDGRGFFPSSKKEALEILARRQPESFDVGLMQVNSRWLEKFGVSPAEALEPETNVRLGAWVLKSCIDRHGLDWDALAAYHTGKTGKGHWRASVYALRVWTRYEKLQQKKP